MSRPMCNRLGCAKPAVFQIGIRAWPTGADKVKVPAVRMWFGLGVCAAHKAELTAAELLSEQSSQQLNRVIKLQGKVPVDWSTAETMHRELLGGNLLRPGLA